MSGAIRQSLAREERNLVKIAMIGAGSVVFVKNLLTDILDLKELGRVVISLHDIDAERLETGGMMARWTAAALGADAAVEEHPDRRAALEGSDFVINMVQIGMHEATLIDFDIPRKYGLKQTIADTVGIGGIFRGLRTIPFMMELVSDMRELCPQAVLLNYTNPMSILTWRSIGPIRSSAWSACATMCNTRRATSPDISGST